MATHTLGKTTHPVAEHFFRPVHSEPTSRSPHISSGQWPRGVKFVRKEDSTMKYTKPSVAEVGTGSGAIQMINNKGSFTVTDASNALSQKTTGHAYDLDEE